MTKPHPAATLTPHPPAGTEYHLYQGRIMFFHGGVRGLRVGQWILPPSITFAQTSQVYASYNDGEYWSDHVYLVTDAGVAKRFAALAVTPVNGRGGDVYQVRPALLLSLDPGCTTEGLSWCAPAAQIVGIVATQVRRAPYQKALIAETQAQQEQPRWNRRFNLPAS